MTLDRYFRLSSYLLIASGFAAVAAGGGAGTVAQVLFTCALVGSWFVDTARLGRALSRRILNALVLVSLFFYAADLMLLSRSFQTGTIHLILFLAALKLVTCSSDRDWILLYLISFAELLVASTLLVDSTFALVLVLFLVSGTSTLVLLEMRMSHARAQRQGRIDPLIEARRGTGSGLQLFARFPAGRIVALSALMTATIVTLAVPLFLILPRVSLGARNRPRGYARLVSGFSERVVLGETGTISQSDSVVMKVRLSESPALVPHALKWRGVALEKYDGHAWTKGRNSRQRVPDFGGYFRLEGSSQGTGILWQTYLLEALSTDVVFAARRVLAVSGDLEYLLRDGPGAMYTAPHFSSKLRYTAVSDISPMNPDLIPREQRDVPAEIGASCLELPALDPRIASLARRVTARETHPFAKARMLERYVRDNHRYSLELGGKAGAPDPLAEFLFESRAGHCEYFATALAVMLRQTGIPARLVNGFRAGEYNGMGDAWVVRQYDAHSWVEAYFSPFGWIEFDPTPAQPRHRKSALAQWAASVYEAIDMWWWEGVVAYDYWKQSSLTRSAFSGLQEMLVTATDHFSALIGRGVAGLAGAGDRSPHWALRRILVILGATGLVVAFCLLIGRASWMKRIRWRLERIFHSSREPAFAVSFYAEALDLLAAHGLRRRPSQTPIEFALDVAWHPVSSPFLALTRIYYGARFGNEFKPEDSAAAEALLSSLYLAFRGRVIGAGKPEAASGRE